MGSRRLTALVACWSSLLSQGCGVSSSPPLEIDSGKVFPSALRPEEWSEAPPRYLVWVVRTRDCLTCQDLDYALRRAQVTYGSTLPLVVVHLGRPVNESVPRAYLRDRRVLASFTSVSPRVFSPNDEDGSIPALLLVRNDTIVWVTREVRGGDLPLDSILIDHLGNGETGHPAP